MSAVCPSCGGNQPDSLLCNTCTLRLKQALAEVPGLVEDLLIAISRMARLTAEQERGGKGSVHERWAIDVDSSAVAWEFDTTIIRWGREIARLVNYGQPATRTALTAASLLSDEMPTVRAHPEAATLVEQVEQVVTRAREHVLGPRERTRIPVGPCPEVNDDGSHCDGQVMAYIPRQDAAPSRMQCRLNPDHRWSSVQFYRAGKRIHDRAERIRRLGKTAAC